MTYSLLEVIKADSEYLVVERQANINGGENLLNAGRSAKRNKKKLFGLFGGPNGNFESPWASDTPGFPSFEVNIENPSLKEAAMASLEVLSQDEDGFFLMIEQGDIDWANHENDFRLMIGTMWEMNEAVQAVIEFVKRPGDDIHWGNTLLIVTSDHANSYMRLRKELGIGDLPSQIYKPQGYKCPPGFFCGSYVYPDGEVSYSTEKHTNELVRLYSLGSGIHLFRQYE